MKLNNKTANGQIYFCEGHQLYHLEFGNVLINLNEDELDKFREYITALSFTSSPFDPENISQKKKITISLGLSTVFISLTPAEFMELKRLLSLHRNSELLQNHEVINYNMIYN